MYTGTLIDELMAAVDRAESNEQMQAVREETGFSYISSSYEIGQNEQNLLGAA